MRLAWLTDIHLNFVALDKRQDFLKRVSERCDAVVISGDIGESPDIVSFLGEMEDVLQKPIYFVLGNHDFYKGSITRTRSRVGQIARQSEHLVYLTQEGVVRLSPNTALVGHDGWADARLGDFDRSDILLNDYFLIEELARWNHDLIPDKNELSKALRNLGDEAAAHFAKVLPEAVSNYRDVIVAIHPPPFREAARYDGRISDDNWLPHLTCQAAGDVIRGVMRSHPSANLLVLCGHTHGRGRVSILDNLYVWAGHAEYGNPEIQEIIDIR
jgi:predicted MPP superfamily phosphohydrolase